MSIKAKLEARYPDEDWSHIDSGADGEQPVFWYSKGVYGISPDMWPVGLPVWTNQEVKEFLES
jgi:hypothetical protein